MRKNYKANDDFIHKRYIEIKSGNCTYKLAQNENTHKYIAKITALEKRHAKLFKVKQVKSKAINTDTEIYSIEDRILNRLNFSAATYNEVINEFGIKHYQPFKSFTARQWERVKVTA